MTTQVSNYSRAALLAFCFVSTAICLHIQQWLGLPLYWVNRSWASSWQAYVKGTTSILMLGLNQWRAPVTATISCDESVKGQIRKGKDGNVMFDFPQRLIFIANHQIYTDWLSLWWTAYTSNVHGYFIVVLKDGIQRIPVIGQGLVFFSWIFLSRRWETDRQRLQQHIQKLSDAKRRTPMWLLIFPEGTNLSKRSMAISQKWADKQNIPPSQLTLLPRARGLQTFLAGLADSVEWLYDCTIAYEQIPCVTCIPSVRPPSRIDPNLPDQI
ncbi:hypothetical protein LTR62_000910 [Meristemomyces frigidus]|uniref:Phospholipid/glycerol acyltransferase domain-containing protein n=1 Tax=Meristemomyces frigidus TaxID=1508187 RepID=A0AAN7THC4_9PEZI|nr:hypothetical protein LTR62_000910 [Meristemomyces frigidus]